MDSQTAARFNFTNYDFPNVIWIRRPGWEVAVKTISFIPVIIVSCLGNGFVIYLVATTSGLRTPMNLFILNMAIADFVSIILFPWIILCMDLYQNFILGSFICQTEGFFRGTQLATFQ